MTVSILVVVSMAVSIVVASLMTAQGLVCVLRQILEDGEELS
jgi:hypothetical protein